MSSCCFKLPVPPGSSKDAPLSVGNGGGPVRELLIPPTITKVRVGGGRSRMFFGAPGLLSSSSEELLVYLQLQQPGLEEASSEAGCWGNLKKSTLTRCQRCFVLKPICLHPHRRTWEGAALQCHLAVLHCSPVAILGAMALLPPFCGLAPGAVCPFHPSAKMLLVENPCCKPYRGNITRICK